MKDTEIIEHILNGWHLNATELKRKIELYLKQAKKNDY